MRLSMRLFQSSRSTVLGEEIQVRTSVLRKQEGLYQLPTPTSKARCTSHVTLTCLVTSTQTSPMLGHCAEPALAFGPLLQPHCPRNRVKVLQHPHPTATPLQGTGSLPAHAQVLTHEPVLALCLGCDAELGQGLLPPKEPSWSRGSGGLTAPGSEVSQVRAAVGPLQPLATSSSISPAAQPPPLDITLLTCSFSTSSFISSAARPAWPCSAAIWWKNLRHFTSTSENCSCGDRAQGEMPRLEPS